jgi:AraC-like DNA-binding protein
MLPQIWSNFELKLLNIDRCRCDTRWRYRNTNSPFSRLLLIIDGEAQVTHHGKKYILRAGNLHLIPCFAFCDYYTPEWFEFYYVHFTTRVEGGVDLFTIQEYEYGVDAGIRSQALFEHLLYLNPARPYCPYRKIANRLQQFSGNQLNVAIFGHDFEVKSEQNPGDIIETDGIMRQLLAPILRTAHAYSDKNKYEAMQYFKDALEFIDNNLDKQITLEEIANQCYLSPVYFSNLFYEKLGIRPTQYINQKRIQKIQTLLVCTNKSIKEISEECGFKDTNYFCRIFKKYIGTSPAKYRKEKK